MGLRPAGGTEALELSVLLQQERFVILRRNPKPRGERFRLDALSSPLQPRYGVAQRAQRAVRVIEETLGPGGEPEQPLTGQSLAAICQSRDVDTTLTAAFPEHRSGELTPDLVGSASEQRVSALRLIGSELRGVL